MAVFKEVKRFDHPAIEKEILGWWKTHQVFEESVRQRAGGPTFTFYEGPPTANGRPGIHHVMGRAIKDIFCRYKTMKGFHVERRAGWDTHGLPVEIEVEKALGLEGRHQVEEYGIARYNAACRESVLEYKELWDQLTVRMGYWVDLSEPYITFRNEYIETLWWLIKRIYERGLLYKGYKIQWYSPGSATVLSSHEVSLGYEEVQDPSVYVRFRAVDEPDASFLAWTTTPWTLISNAALAVGSDLPYVKVRGRDAEGAEEYLYLAQDRLGVLGDGYEIVEQFRGRDLVGRAYRPLYGYFLDEVQRDAAWYVAPADFVTTDEGTGIVHIAPAFGADDFDLGLAENLPLLNPVTPDGTFTDKATLVAGEWFKNADKKIVRDLRDRGLVFRQETYLHNYPHDWRKGTPLMSYPVESWFIRTTAIKDRLIALNDTINWQPAAIGRGRFGEWLKNNIDWALSRRRYWGTPLPVWTSDAPGSEYFEVIGSIAELREKCGDQVPPDRDLDLHRPFVDAFTWPAPDGGTMRRVPDLLDVWFDSGAMPFAQWHYPFENQDAFARTFPADFIAEGVDQTRGWFYTLHAIAALVMDDVAYRNVVVNGLVLDENGEKMSKSKGNAADPFETIAHHGADVVRWYMMSNTVPWENLKFSERGLTETLRKFLGTLANSYSFFATYANIDGFAYGDTAVPRAKRTELDRWIFSRLNTTVAEVDASYEGYNPTRAARAVERFVDELSNWYIRRSRRRFWKAADSADDKRAAYETVFECLLAIGRLMSPIAPFFSEWLYGALTKGASTAARRRLGVEAMSVHLAQFPSVEHEAIEVDLERRMELARKISSTTLALRNQAGINVRQPLPRIIVVTGTGVAEADLKLVRDVIVDEVNVKDVAYVSGSSEVVKRTAKPDFKRLGKRLGPLMKSANEVIRGFGDAEIDQLLSEGWITLELDGSMVRLDREDVDITSEGMSGWLVGQEEGVTIALDTELTDELVSEGLARESINRIQNLRKSADFDVTDRISIQFSASERLARAMSTHAAWIRNETLALELHEAEKPVGTKVETFEIGAEVLTVGVRRTGNGQAGVSSAP